MYLCKKQDYIKIILQVKKNTKLQTTHAVNTNTTETKTNQSRTKHRTPVQVIWCPWESRCSTHSWASVVSCDSVNQVLEIQFALHTYCNPSGEISVQPRDLRGFVPTLTVPKKGIEGCGLPDFFALSKGLHTERRFQWKIHPPSY